MTILQRALSALDVHPFGKLIVVATMVGVMAGLCAISFDVLSQLVVRFTLDHFAGYAPPEAAGEHLRIPPFSRPFLPWAVVAVITLGGLVSGTLVYTLAPEAEGHGTDASIDAFHNRRGIIRARIPLVKTVASAVTLGTGGSGGREGPIAQIGAGCGSWLATRLKLSDRERRLMLAAGMGAGIGAIFRAPLAGAVFASEILYSDADFEADAVVPAATASIVAYIVYTQSLPMETRFIPLFGSDLEHTVASPSCFIPFTVLGIILAAVGILYVKLLYRTTDVFRQIPLWPHLRPAMGAGLSGLIAIGLLNAFDGDLRVMGVLGTGYGTLQLALTSASELGLPVLLAVAFGKIVTTSLTLGSGGSAGVFGPSMVIGGCSGGAVGLAVQAIWPHSTVEPEAFAVVGMAGFFAGVARAPISTIIMVRALTGDYGLLLPTMLVSTLTFVLCHRYRLYHKQVPTRMDSKAHRGDFIVDVLEGVRVRDVYRANPEIMMIPEAMTLEEIVHSLAHNHQHYFPVVNDRQQMVGIFSDNDVRSYLYDDTLWELANARDVMTSDFLFVTPNETLNAALRRFTALNLDELPVLDPESPGKLLGMLRRKEAIAAYNRRLMELKQASEEDAGDGGPADD